ncbi:MAG: HEAT repeat domain-containing protein [Planctomycetes bacterium]|nr:HEAT repeat domain-containing protein [Planctomycetota bacterium]
MSRIFAVIILCLAAGLEATAQDRPVDELDRFFAGQRGEPTEAQMAEVKALWRKAQIGARDDRQDARVRLTELGRVATAFLENELRSSSADDVRVAAMVLGRVGDEAVADLLRELIFGEKGLPAGGRHLVLALGLVGDRGDLPRLLGLLHETKRNDERRALCYAIGALGGPEQAAALAAHWKEDKAQEFRAALLLALGRMGGDGALDVLREGLRSNKETIRRAATLAAADLRLAELVPDLIRALKDNDEDVVKAALIGLALRPDEAAAQALRRSNLWRDGDDELRSLCLMALGAQAGEAVDRLLQSRLKPRGEHADEVLRSLAFALLGEPGRLAGEARDRLLAVTDPEVARALWCGLALRSRQSAGLMATAFAAPSCHDRLRATLLELLAHVDPERAAELCREIIDRREHKKELLERAQELLDLITGKEPGGRALLSARVQVEIDDLGGSREWNLLRAIAREIRRTEDIDRDFSSAFQNRPGQPPRRPEPWTHEDEDLRLWYDRHPYFDRRRALDVDP